MNEEEFEEWLLNKPKKRYITHINLKDVISVYSGVKGLCCCGCSGKHTYSGNHFLYAEKRRGYHIKENEIDIKIVKRIVNIVNKALNENQENFNYEDMVSFDRNKKTYIVYLKT